jgi:excisionase family DNA binding protein
VSTIQEIRPAYTKKDVATRLNCSVRKVETMIEKREIVGFYVGNEWRMRPENLERWIDKKEKQTA